jgi:hypothetical protein
MSCILIIGDQSETQTCIGPFRSFAAAFAWAESQDIDMLCISGYNILSPTKQKEEWGKQAAERGAGV